jgi:transposase InsO family protein
VNNVGDLWELDLAMTSLVSHNDGHRYLLNVIDTFSKYAYSVPNRMKAAGAFRSVMVRHGGRPPLVVRTGKGKEFVNAKFRKILEGRGIESRVCRNPDVKCAVAERFNRTLKTKLYKWFTRNNTYRYVEVLENVVSGYDAVTPARGWLPRS